ncbi:hypothetical protein FDECE_15930 [Fusarium decemcellulare]|nr:hypothetical protein FDECE_15930 [Fusarium decemcellulare]
MNQTKSEASRWVLLIGVDGVQRHTNQNRSAAADVLAIEKYLTTWSPPPQTFTLTTLSGDFNHSATEHPVRIDPTYDNLVEYLQMVIDSGNEGDHVYVHYSGHGTRKNVRLSGKEKRALGLIVFQPTPTEPKVFPGTTLRGAVDLMVRKGMLVTVVLDCCFSGNVLRKSPLRSASRYLEYDSTMDDSFDMENPFVGESHRGASLACGEELLNPDGYSILTACGIDEEAGEVVVDGSHRGALSYSLLDSLNMLQKLRVQVSHHTLHQHLRANFQARHQVQTPRLYGKTGLSFFNEVTKKETPLCAYSNDKHELILNSGEIHGVHIDDEYELRSSYASTAASGVSQNAIVTSVNDVNSILRMVDYKYQFTDIEIWDATMLTTLSPHRTRIMVDHQIPNAIDILDSSKGIPFLDLVLQAEGGCSSHRPQESSTFYVELQEDFTYRVSDATSNKVANFPSINQHAVQALVKNLSHIATYKFYQRIENLNPEPNFSQSFSMTLLGHTPGADGIYRINQKEGFKFQFKNLSKGFRYVAILAFDCFWEISSCIPAKGNSYCLDIPRNSSEEIQMAPSVVQELTEQGFDYADDMVKIFVTSEQTFFHDPVLPRIGSDDFRSHGDSVELVKQRMWANPDGRGGKEGNWVTKTFHIRTCSSAY